MAKLNIFISYSHHADTTTCYALRGALTGPNTEVHLNTGQIHTHELHRQISSVVNRCDVIIPIVTDTWLASPECRDELVRANERRKPIIPFVHRSFAEHRSKLPWYMQEMPWVSWHENEVDRAFSDLREKLSAIEPNSWRAACYRDIRKIGDGIQKSEDVPGWKSALVQRILQLAKGQLDKVLHNDECSFPVAQEQAYLRFAEPVFGQAKSIIAICIASISTFWTSPDFRNDAGQYLSNQRDSASSIVRLFVFDSKSELALFRQILQKHYDSYGFHKDGNGAYVSGVFLCSTDCYRKLLSRWSLASDGRAMHQDFGLLRFEDCELRMHATLDNREFRYDIYDPNEGGFGGYLQVEKYFDGLKKLGVGKQDPETGTMRWSPEWGHDDDALTEAAEILFQRKEHPTTHIVLIRPNEDSPRISEFLRNLVVRFHQLRQELKISSITLKKRSDLARTDGRFNAPLLVLEEFEYFLAMTFESERSLQHYYMHEFHSVEREKLYRLLNPTVDALFDEVAATRQVPKRAELFSRIEAMMIQGGYLQRIDVSDHDPLALLLNQFAAE